MSDSFYEFGETPEEAADKAWQSADFDAMRLRPELSTPEPEKPHEGWTYRPLSDRWVCPAMEHYVETEDIGRCGGWSKVLRCDCKPPATCHTCNGTKKKPSLTGDIHFDEPCPECSTDESPIFRAEYMGEWVPEKPAEPPLPPPPEGWKWHECTVRGEDSVVLYEPGAGVQHGWMSRARACKGGYTPSVQTRRTHWLEYVFGPEPPDFRKREGA